MAEGPSGIEQNELLKASSVAVLNKPEIPPVDPITRKNLLSRLIPTLKSSKVREQIRESLTGDEYNRESVLGSALIVLDAEDHLVSVLQKSEAIRANTALRLNASRLNAEGVSGKSIIEILEKGDKASEQAIDEVFKRFIRNYAEAGKLSEEYVGSLSIGKPTLDAIAELEKRIPKKAISILLEQTDSWKTFVNSVNLSNEELFALSPEIAPIVNKDFNMISITEEASKFFAFHLSKNKLFTPEQKEEALKTLERWYTGNYNAETGKITLYRFVNMKPEMLDDIIQNGVSPRGVRTAGNEEAVLQYLDKNGGGGWYNTLAKSFRLQKAGEDISEFVEQYKKDSRSGFDYDLATYWTTENESRLFGNSGYRIAVELDPKDAWRSITLKNIKKGYIDDDYSLSTISFEEFSKGQFEWTVLGNIPSDKIKIITDLSSKKEVFKR